MSKEIVPRAAGPRPFTFDEAITAIDNATYRIQDLHIKDSRGRDVFTISTTVLHPSMQTSGHLHELDNEIYEFIEGKGVMLVGKLAIFVEAGDFVYVEKTQFHKVINSSNSVDLTFRCYFNGKIQRPHLGK